MILFEIIVWLCCFYLLFPLFSGLLAVLGPRENLQEEPFSADFACIIPVYKEKDIAWPLVRALLKQEYPHYQVYLVADGIEEPLEKQVQDERLTLFQPNPFLNSKVASIALVLEKMKKKHSHVVIFDPDNLVPPHFLGVLNRYHAAGFQAVQGKRIAKNTSGTYAALDALGEYYYDFAVRNVPYRLGSSSTIAGSGMSLEREIYQQNISHEMQVLKDKGLVVAEDKSLQVQLVGSGIRIGYAAAAIVFDEKITAAPQIGRQRSRWLNSYFGQIPTSFRLLLKGLVSGDWNRIYFAIMVSMPPMVILVGVSLLLLVAALWMKVSYFFLLAGALILFGLGFLTLLAWNHTPGEVIKAIPKIPLFVWGQLSGMLKIRKASKDFMATSHQEITEMEPLWEKRQHEFSHLQAWWK